MKYGSQVAVAMVRQSNTGWPLSKKSYRLSFLKALGIEVPPNLSAEVDEIIE
jgi:hypothetical protein